MHQEVGLFRALPQEVGPFTAGQEPAKPQGEQPVYMS